MHKLYASLSCYYFYGAFASVAQSKFVIAWNGIFFRISPTVLHRRKNYISLERQHTIVIFVYRFLTITTQITRASAPLISALKLKVTSWQSLLCVDYSDSWMSSEPPTVIPVCVTALYWSSLKKRAWDHACF